MHKFFLCTTFFLTLSFCSFDKSDAFPYSIKNLEFQNSVYSFKITKSQLNSFDYTFNWVPTKQLLISSNLINLSKNTDNKLYYAMNVGFFFLKNNIISIGINSLAGLAMSALQEAKTLKVKYIISSMFILVQLIKSNL